MLWWICTGRIPGDIPGNLSLHEIAMCDATEVFAAAIMFLVMVREGAPATFYRTKGQRNAAMEASPALLPISAQPDTG